VTEYEKKSLAVLISMDSKLNALAAKALNTGLVGDADLYRKIAGINGQAAKTLKQED